MLMLGLRQLLVVMHAHMQHFFRVEELADAMKSEGDHFYQQAKVAAEATGAAAITARAR